MLWSLHLCLSPMPWHVYSFLSLIYSALEFTVNWYDYFFKETRQIKVAAQCLWLLPLWGMGRVGCMQPCLYVQRDCFYVSNLRSPGHNKATLPLHQCSPSKDTRQFRLICHFNLFVEKSAAKQCFCYIYMFWFVTMMIFIS